MYPEDDLEEDDVSIVTQTMHMNLTVISTAIGTLSLTFEFFFIQFLTRRQEQESARVLHVLENQLKKLTVVLVSIFSYLNSYSGCGNHCPTTPPHLLYHLSLISNN